MHPYKTLPSMTKLLLRTVELAALGSKMKEGAKKWGQQQHN
jgi:hypothetical protein